MALVNVPDGHEAVSRLILEEEKSLNPVLARSGKDHETSSITYKDCFVLNYPFPLSADQGLRSVAGENLVT